MTSNTSMIYSQIISQDGEITPTEQLGIAIFVCLILFFPGVLVCKKYRKWRIRKQTKHHLSPFNTKNFAFKWKQNAIWNRKQITWGLQEKHGLDNVTFIRRLVESEISMNFVKMDKLLKIGKTVRVFEATLKTKGTIQNVAAKMLQNGFTKEDYRLMNAKIQFFSTKKLAHPNVVKFIGAIRHDDTYGPIMIFELCLEHTVREWLEDFRTQVDDDTLIQIKKFALDIGQGMMYLSEQKIIHKRLAARNVLLNDKLEAKVGCFGPRHKDKCSHPFERERMPIQWFAPESLVELNTYSTESDVWSYGVTLWEIFSVGDLPYINYNNREIIDLLNDGYRLMKPRYADSRFYELMKSCWKMKPENRPTFSSIVRELHDIVSVCSESDE